MWKIYVQLNAAHDYQIKSLMQFYEYESNFIGQKYEILSQNKDSNAHSNSINEIDNVCLLWHNVVCSTITAWVNFNDLKFLIRILLKCQNNSLHEV